MSLSCTILFQAPVAATSSRLHHMIADDRRYRTYLLTCADKVHTGHAQKYKLSDFLIPPHVCLYVGLSVPTQSWLGTWRVKNHQIWIAPNCCSLPHVWPVTHPKRLSAVRTVRPPSSLARNTERVVLSPAKECHYVPTNASPPPVVRRCPH